MTLLTQTATAANATNVEEPGDTAVPPETGTGETPQSGEPEEKKEEPTQAPTRKEFSRATEEL